MEYDPQKYSRVNKEAYNQLAKEYQKRLERYRISDREIAAPFIKHLKGQFKTIHILELGPGSGLNLLFFKEEEFTTTAIDIAENMISVAKEIVPDATYICDDFIKHDFGKTHFEGVFAKAFIHLFPKEEAYKVLKKMKELLVPHGAIYISTTLHKTNEEGFFEKEDYGVKMIRFRKKWREEELLDMLTSVNLKIIDKGYFYEEDFNKKWINLVLTTIDK